MNDPHICNVSLKKNEGEFIDKTFSTNRHHLLLSCRDVPESDFDNRIEYHLGYVMFINFIELGGISQGGTEMKEIFISTKDELMHYQKLCDEFPWAKDSIRDNQDPPDGGSEYV